MAFPLKASTVLLPASVGQGSRRHQARVWVQGPLEASTVLLPALVGQGSRLRQARVLVLGPHVLRSPQVPLELRPRVIRDGAQEPAYLTPKSSPSPSKAKASSEPPQTWNQVFQVQGQRPLDRQVLDREQSPWAVLVGQVQVRPQTARSRRFAVRCQAPAQQAHPVKLGWWKRFEQETPGSERSSSARRPSHRQVLETSEAWEFREAEQAGLQWREVEQADLQWLARGQPNPRRSAPQQGPYLRQ